ncbi:MAG TPA: Rrf2 family transcriptional regulator [Burkholderiales bacterium]|nr:Rrf2 family transcriptional regulator [Burkholderiales bacterium]
MRLTRYTDYSLRVLLYLSYKKGEPATIAEIAGFYRISRNHLVKIVHSLGMAGFVQTTRGKGGGIRLAKDARLISIGNVVRKTEPDLDLLECFNPRTDRCAITRVCRLKGVLFAAKSAFMSELDRCTLADIGQMPAPSGKSGVPIAGLFGDRKKKRAPVS